MRNRVHSQILNPLPHITSGMSPTVPFSSESNSSTSDCISTTGTQHPDGPAEVVKFVTQDLDEYGSSGPMIRRWKTLAGEKAEGRFFGQYIGQTSDTFGLWATINKKENRYIGYC